MCSDGVQPPLPPEKRMGGRKAAGKPALLYSVFFFFFCPFGQLDCWHKSDGESVGGIQLISSTFFIFKRVKRWSGHLEGQEKEGRLCPANRDEHQLAGKLTTNTYASRPRGFSGAMGRNVERRTEKEFWKKHEELITSTYMQGEVTHNRKEWHTAINTFAACIALYITKKEVFTKNQYPRPRVDFSLLFEQKHSSWVFFSSLFFFLGRDYSLLGTFSLSFFFKESFFFLFNVINSVSPPTSLALNWLLSGGGVSGCDS